MIDKRNQEEALGVIDGQSKITKETWITRDFYEIPWPFEDNYFDFSVCVHTLEDLKDPIPVIKEIQRVSKMGYLSMPTRAQESNLYILNRNILEDGITGYCHHRWFVEIINEQLIFTNKCCLLPFFKNLFINNVVLESLHFFWNKSFQVKEKYLGGAKEALDDCRRFKYEHDQWLTNPRSNRYSRWEPTLGETPDFKSEIQLRSNSRMLRYQINKIKQYYLKFNK